MTCPAFQRPRTRVDLSRGVVRGRHAPRGPGISKGRIHQQSCPDAIPFQCSRTVARGWRDGVWLSATLARGCEALGRGRVREEQQVEQARRIEVSEVRLGESAEGGLVRGAFAGQLERVAVGGTFPATGDGR